METERLSVYRAFNRRELNPEEEMDRVKRKRRKVGGEKVADRIVSVDSDFVELMLQGS